MLSHSVLSDSSRPQEYSLQAPLSMGILQTRILEWVAYPFSRGSSPPRNQTRVLLDCRQILYQLSYQGKLQGLDARFFYRSRKCPLLSCVQHFETPWTVALQAPLSIGFSRQEYWSGLPFPSPGYLPDPGIKPGSLALQADFLPSESPGNL